MHLKEEKTRFTNQVEATSSPFGQSVHLKISHYKEQNNI